jgi:hypothetical protein
MVRSVMSSQGMVRRVRKNTGEGGRSVALSRSGSVESIQGMVRRVRSIQGMSW